MFLFVVVLYLMLWYTTQVCVFFVLFVDTIAYYTCVCVFIFVVVLCLILWHTTQVCLFLFL